MDGVNPSSMRLFCTYVEARASVPRPALPQNNPFVPTSTPFLFPKDDRALDRTRAHDIYFSVTK
jgi:hypothetical protein